MIDSTLHTGISQTKIKIHLDSMELLYLLDAVRDQINYPPTPPVLLAQHLGHEALVRIERRLVGMTLQAKFRTGYTGKLNPISLPLTTVWMLHMVLLLSDTQRLYLRRLAGQVKEVLSRYPMLRIP